MFKNVILLVILFLLSCSYLYSQNKINVTGTVIDSIQNTPIDYCSVSLIDQQTGKIVDGVISNTKGIFSLVANKPGVYRLKADFIAYHSYIKDSILIGKADVNIGTLLLQPSVINMNEVTITGTKSTVENQIDKMVYNPGNDLTAQGGVAIDILKKVPMVSVDINGNVELMGSSNVRFLINGKPSSIFGASITDALQSIPASQIKSIDVITSPGAKYDATGTGGIINIVLKENNIQGVNGNVNLSAGTRFENGSFTLNTRKGNFGIGVFLNGNMQLNTTSKNTSIRQSYSAAKDTINQLSQQGESPYTRNGYRSGINLNWSITKKDELTASLNYNHFENHGTGITNQDQQLLLPTTGNVLSDLITVRTSDSRMSENSTDWSLSYKKTFNKKDQELDILYTSSFGNNLNNASQITNNQTGNILSSGLRSNNPGKDHESEISVDYTQPVIKGFTIETGGKVILQDITNSVLTDTLLTNGDYARNNGQSNSFNYKRSIYAAYLSTSFALFHDFLIGKAGLRYERTNTTADFAGTSIPGYNTFAPSFTVQHKLNETQSIKLAYSYRIERPDYGDLNPFFNISDPHNISTGNPLVRPEIGHNYELGYNKSFEKGGNIYVAGYYRHNTDDMQSFTTYYNVLNVNGTDYTDVALTSRTNIGTQTTVGANIFGSVPLTNELNLRSNIQLGERTNTNPGLASVSGFSYRANLNVSYQLPRDLAFEVFANYNSSQKNISSTRPAFFFYNLAIRKQFMNKKASIGITAANPFGMYITQKSATYGSNFYQTNIRQFPFQSFGITLNYKFGKLEFKKDVKDDNSIPQEPEI
ncbi:MAG: TonB-dependent receptor [Paludibacter sp.]|nr:TonB-dependent receptor [Paludibacter sp.]